MRCGILFYVKKWSCTSQVVVLACIPCQDFKTATKLIIRTGVRMGEIDKQIRVSSLLAQGPPIKDSDMVASRVPHLRGAGYWTRAREGREERREGREEEEKDGKSTAEHQRILSDTYSVESTYESGAGGRPRARSQGTRDQPF
jgi:hypothetical protein